MASRAKVAPSNVQPHDAAPDRRPEGDVDLVFQIRPRLRPFVRRAATAAEHTGEDILEASASGAGGFPTATATFEQVGEIKAAEIKICALPARARRLPAREPSGKSAGRPSGSAARAGIGIRRRGINVVRIKPKLVVNLALLGIAQDIVGFRKRLELLLRGLVSRIDVGMVLARKFAERFANVLGGGRLFYAKRGVVVFGLCCHRLRT